MAEIEVVSDGARREDEDEEAERRRRGGAAVAEPDPVVDVYSAAAYGDLERLREFVERGGAAAALREPDGNGYHALQWAALNNYPHVALYLIEVASGFYFYLSSAPASPLLCSLACFGGLRFERFELRCHLASLTGFCLVPAARGRRERDGPRAADGAALGGGARVHVRGRRARGARREGRGRRRQRLPGNAAPLCLYGCAVRGFLSCLLPLCLLGCWVEYLIGEELRRR